ncbi:MAG: hypothetical protein NVSMB9_11530 [Isosphaeraceae bacterium]
MKETGKCSLARSAFAVQEKTREWTSRTARRSLRRKFVSRETCEIEKLSQGGSERFGLVNHSVIAKCGREGFNRGLSQMSLDRPDNPQGQSISFPLRFSTLSNKSVRREPIWNRISRVKDTLGFGMNPVDLVDEKLTRSETTGFIRESQVRNHDREELLVQKFAG